VWLGEIPNSIHFLNQDVTTKYPIIQMIETQIENVSGDIDSARSAALKIFWATGGQGHWAFLGVTFQPQTSSACVVRVGISADETGLIPQLAQAVNAQAIRSITQRKSPLTGILCFERAINHPIDSSPKLFRLATDCLIQVLEPGYDSVLDGAIADVLEQSCKGW